MVSKKTSEDKKSQSTPSQHNSRSSMRFFSFLIVALLVVAVILAVSWEKVIEPKVGFDLPDSTREGAVTESISSQPAGVHHVTGNDAQNAPEKVLQTSYQEYPIVFDKLMDTLQEQMSAIVAESPSHKQEKILNQLQTIHAIKGFQDGYISSATLKAFLDKNTNIQLSEDITRESKMLTAQQLVAMLDTPTSQSDTADAQGARSSWWDDLQSWVMSSVHVTKTEDAQTSDAEVRSAIVQKQWKQALNQFESMPKDWQVQHQELKTHIKARIALDQLIEHSYEVLLNGGQQ